MTTDVPVSGSGQHDVAIIGAGLSGLVAAHRLVEAGVTDVVVMEASDRVGGRTLSHRLADGTTLDVGGQWAARAHTRLLALAAEMGVPTFPTYCQGRHLLVTGGKRYRYRKAPPPWAAPVGLADLVQSLVRMDRMARSLPDDEPWRAAKAATWDAQTLQAWLLRSTRTRLCRALWCTMCMLTMGGAPHDVSLLFALSHIRAAGGLSKLIDVEGGAQELRFQGGSWLISTRLADRLGARIALGRPVVGLRQDADGVDIECADGAVRARRVIVAMSPAVAERIAVEPRLPQQRARLQRRLTMVTGLKLQAVYERPFWRADGLSGQAVSDTGPVPIVFDNSPAGHDPKPGVLVGFATFDQRMDIAMPAELADDSSARRDAVLTAFARFFGSRARDAIDYVDKDWGEEKYLHGCIPSKPPGLITEVGPAARTPVGRLHWAGAESGSWDGYLEGAVEAGERAAAEVTKTLGAP